MSSYRLIKCYLCHEDGDGDCWHVFVEDAKSDTAKTYTWHKDAKFNQENQAMCFKILTDMHETTKEFENEESEELYSLSYVQPPRPSKKYYEIDYLLTWIHQYNCQIVHRRIFLRSHTIANEPSPPTTPNHTIAYDETHKEPEVVRRKRRLSGIALLDYMLARQNEPPATHTPVAKRAKRQKRNPPEEQQPVRRSKRIAAKAPKETNPPAKRRRKTTKKQEVEPEVPEVPEVAEPSGIPEVGDHLDVEEEDFLQARPMTYKEKIAMYFQRTDPDFEPEPFVIEDSYSTHSSWVEYTDRETNPDARSTLSRVYYEDSEQSCDSEVASNDDPDRCPAWVDGFVEDQMRATFTGEFERPADEPKENESLSLGLRMKIMWRYLQTKSTNLYKDYVVF